MSGLQALKRVWRPFLLIQCFALAAVLSYYLVPGAAGLWVPFGEWKASSGYVGSALATILASLGLPEIARRLTRRPRAATWRDVAFEAAFFGTMGAAVDLIYRIQSVWFGDGLDAQTLFLKLIVDQFGFAPAFAIPLATVGFAWRESGFSGPATRSLLAAGAWKARYWSLLTTCWAFWIPTVLCIYAMPPGLQIPLYLFTQGAWSLLVVTLTSRE